MYVVFFGYGNYKTFRDRTEALIFFAKVWE